MKRSKKFRLIYIGVLTIALIILSWSLWNLQSGFLGADTSAVWEDSALHGSQIDTDYSSEFELGAVRRQEIADSWWRIPIVFYGKVVDESGEAVVGADVNCSVTDESQEGRTQYSLTSDADGLFSLSGVRGRNLVVRVSKEGYYQGSGSMRSIDYADPRDFKPIPDAPVVFRLHKKGETAALVQYRRSVTIPPDGSATYVSLYSGKVTQERIGHLVVRIWNLAPGAARGEKYDWRCEIEVPGGGLLATDEEFPFEAPMEGYSMGDVFDMEKDRQPGWTREFERNYYVRLRDGNYGVMQFKAIAARETFVILEAVVNPDGERNLEFDRGQVVKTTESIYGVIFTYPDGQRRSVSW